MPKKLLAPFFFIHFGLFAQTLQLSSAAGTAGDRIIVELSLKSPAGVEASTLQWEITTPTAQLTFLDKETVIGPRAQSAGKAVTCALKSSNHPESSAACMLYGGRESIRDGVIARLMFKIAPDAAPGTARIRISHALAVSKDLQRIPLQDAETVVRIQSK